MSFSPIRVVFIERRTDFAMKDYVEVYVSCKAYAMTIILASFEVSLYDKSAEISSSMHTRVGVYVDRRGHSLYQGIAHSVGRNHIYKDLQ